MAYVSAPTIQCLVKAFYVDSSVSLPNRTLIKLVYAVLLMIEVILVSWRGSIRLSSRNVSLQFTLSSDNELLKAYRSRAATSCLFKVH